MKQVSCDEGRKSRKLEVTSSKLRLTILQTILVILIIGRERTGRPERPMLRCLRTSLSAGGPTATVGRPLASHSSSWGKCCESMWISSSRPNYLRFSTLDTLTNHVYEVHKTCIPNNLNMRFTLFTFLFALLLSLALAAAPQKAIVVSFADPNTPQSAVDNAMKAIKDAGGVITHEYSMYRA